MALPRQPSTALCSFPGVTRLALPVQRSHRARNKYLLDTIAWSSTPGKRGLSPGWMVIVPRGGNQHVVDLRVSCRKSIAMQSTIKAGPSRAWWGPREVGKHPNDAQHRSIRQRTTKQYSSIVQDDLWALRRACYLERIMGLGQLLQRTGKRRCREDVRGWVVRKPAIELDIR